MRGCPMTACAGVAWVWCRGGRRRWWWSLVGVGAAGRVRRVLRRVAKEPRVILVLPTKPSAPGTHRLIGGPWAGAGAKKAWPRSTGNVHRTPVDGPRVTVIVVNGHPRSSNPRSYTDTCTPHSFETCPVHGQRVRFNALGELEGRCWKCSEEAAQGIRHIEETIA
jgi:hypothetical protein